MLETIILFIVTWCTIRASSKDVFIRNHYQFLAISPVFISYNIRIESFYLTNPREAEYIDCFVARPSILVIWPSGNEQVDREMSRWIEKYILVRPCNSFLFFLIVLQDLLFQIKMCYFINQLTNTKKASHWMHYSSLLWSGLSWPQALLFKVTKMEKLACK